MFTFFADTDCDVTPQIAEKHGIRLISMPYSIDGVNVYPYEDFRVFDQKKFYDALRAGTLPSTSAISEERYFNYFEPEFAAGKDILYVHFSREMTASFGNMDKAVEHLLKLYPERKFYAIDTKGITTLGLAVVLAVADLIEEGKTPEEIVEWSKTEVDRFAMWFFADDLKFFRRSGRVGGLKATMGTLLGIRPIIHISAQGKMESVGSEKGRLKAMQTIANHLVTDGDNVKSHPILIGHTDCLELAEQVGDMIKEMIGQDAVIEYYTVNPTAGAHCGPNAVGVCFRATHR